MTSNAQTYEFHDAESMLGVVNDPTKVPRAAEKSLYVEADDGGDVMAQLPNGDSAFLGEMDDYKVVYDPETGQIFDVVTDEYAPIQPPEFIGPLASELQDRNRSVEGKYSMFDGGRGYLEVLLSDSGVWPRDRDSHQEPVRTGVTVSWSHDGGVSVKARGFAQDGACSNTMRRVSDSVYVKHAGDVESRIDWTEEWATVLDQLGAFSTALEDVIDGAFDHVLWDLNVHTFSDDWVTATDGLQKLDELGVAPFAENHRDGINGFFDLLGFPGYICYHATSRLFWRLSEKDADNTGEVTAWDAYSALTYALTHQAQFEAGSSSDDDYHRIASELLMNPELAERDASSELQSRLRDDETGGVTIEGNVGDAMRTYKERENRLRSAFEAE